MTNVQNALQDIRQLARQPTARDEAERRMQDLIDSLPALELSEAQQMLRAVVEESFLPKRRAKLLQRLEQGLTGTGFVRDAQQREGSASEARDAVESLAAFRVEMRSALNTLADRHIFQWAYYEDFASQLFDTKAPRALSTGVTLDQLTVALREELSVHSKEIFQRGFAYATTRQHLSVERALEMANFGLARLLSIAVSEYRRQLGRLRVVSRTAELRGVCSALASGTLLGRCHNTFGTVSGAEHLIESWKLWSHFLAFITLHDQAYLAERLPLGTTRDRLFRVSGPLAAALDEQAARPSADQVCVLRASTYSSRFDRLELSLVEPVQATQKELVFHCYLSESGIDRTEIESAVSRGMQLILAPLSDELARWVHRHDPPLAHTIIDTSKSDASDRLRDNLSIALASLGTGRHQNVPITFNFARRFPLDKPDIGADFRVVRRSVRALLERHHSNNGVRLWCSVRRSGKTTACIDLQTHQGPEIVITETCERTGSANLKDSFYQAAAQALESGTQLPQGFVAEAIRRAADYDVGNSRLVFVLDEYESLFRQLEIAALERESVRYRVVQPLLNQLVEFAHDNLLILLGLNPSAHFILMDQNQLSPYVQADEFPLFEFENQRPDCEFRDLVRRVLTERIQCDDGFVGHLFAETGGHPVLTVNVLTSVCDWLIETKRPLSRLNLGNSDFSDFASRHLTAQAVGLNDVYDVHRKFAQSGLSAQSRKRTPWIYAVLSVLRHIAVQAEDKMSCSLGEVARVLERLGLDQEAGLDADEIVRTGCEANFFRVSGRTVKPRIRLYARLTASVVPSSRF